MTQTTVDSLPVAQLPDRYSISRSVLYERLADLQIKTQKRGNKAYVNAPQIELLDRLHEHLRSGGSTADFLVSAGLFDSASAGLSDGRLGQFIGQAEVLSTGLSGKLSARRSDGQRLIDDAMAIAVLGEMLIALTPQSSPLANLEALEQACQHGWLLSTSQLAPLLGLKTLSGREIQRYGFICTRVGKNGAESAWQIRKAQPQQSNSHSSIASATRSLRV